MNWTHQSAGKGCIRSACAVFVALVLSSCGKKGSQTPPTLGMSFTQVEALCGHGEINLVKAPHYKTVSYQQSSGNPVKAAFYDDAVATVWYNVNAGRIDDQQLQYYLQLNAQGHYWTLLDAKTGGDWLSAHWIRDDGATADCGGEDGPFLDIVGPEVSLCGVPDASPAPAQPTRSGSTLALRQNVVPYVAKFGKPFTRDSGFAAPATTTLLFNHKIEGTEFMINLSFWHGAAHLALVSRRDKAEFTDRDIRNVLELFSDGEHWERLTPETSFVEQKWQRSGNVGAFVQVFDSGLKVLTITTQEFWKEHVSVSDRKSSSHD